MKRGALAILVKRFPKLSETFILQEILALESLGWPITIFTLEHPSDEIVHADVARVKAEIIQLDSANPAADLARQVQKRRLRHIHAHFANHPAAIARDAAKTAKIGYSVSAHAKDIYLTDDVDLGNNLRNARFVSTCTSFNAQHLREIARGVPVAKLYHGIDCGKLCPDDHEPQSPPLILSVGRLRSKKGLDTLIDACAELRNQQREFVCEIIGYGPEEEVLRAQIDELALEAHVRLLGKLPHDDVLTRMRAASLFALPCRIDADGDRDGIPNVILEAMAIGVPVVSTPVSGVPEIVDDGVSGILVEPEDPGQLAQALANLLDSSAHRERLASAGRSAVARRFGEGRDIAALDRLLLTATGESAGTIGYVVKGFPRLSESFISNEILKLETLGKDIVTFAASHGDEMAAAVLADMTSPLAYLPQAGSVSKNTFWGWLKIVAPTYAPSHLRLLKRHPGNYLSTLRQTLHFAHRYRFSKDRCAKRAFFKQFAQAGAIAEAAERAGVTHLHGHFCHSATTITWLAAKMAGLSFSFTAHAKDIYQAKHNPRDLLARKVEAAEFVTTCTAANHEHMAERVDCPAKLHTVYHGLDTNFFASGERLSSISLRILAVGRHVDKKGFALLIDALAELENLGINFDCRIVGEEGPATRQLAQAILDRNLEGRCRLDPPEPRSKLRDSYGRADIFVLPCRIDDSGDRDGIPNVLAEAMATGLAVISTNVSGIPEIVNDGENGLLVPPDNVVELAGAIARLHDDPALRQQLGVAAAQRIREIFDADRTILDLKRLFDGAMHVEPTI